MRKGKLYFKSGNNSILKSVTSLCLVSFLAGMSSCDVVRSETSISNFGGFENISQSNGTVGSTIESSISSEATIPTETPEEYSFEWNYDIDVEFNNYIIEETGYTIDDYVTLYGFQDNIVLENYFIQFVNNKYSTNYEYIPFSEARYFNRVINADGEAIDHQAENDENTFCERFLRETDPSFGTENPIFNKYFLSYLVWSGIPFGEQFGYSDYVEINPNFDDIDFNSLIDYYWSNTGNNIDWTTQDNLSFSMYLYNRNIFYLCRNEAVYDMNIAGDEELRDTFNQYLRNYFGENAPQFGEPFTREMYVEMFGEEPYQFTFLPDTPTMLAENPSRQR